MTYLDAVDWATRAAVIVAPLIVGAMFLAPLVAKVIAFTGKASSDGDRYALAVRRMNRRWTRIEDYRQ